MTKDINPIWLDYSSLAQDFIKSLREVNDWPRLRDLVRGIADELGFRYFALVTHEDLRCPGPGKVDLRDYPDATSARLIEKARFRRDPVMRGCIFAETAFLWSELREIIRIDHHDRIAFELGMREGLNEGITVPCTKHGQCLGSCTFAGLKTPRRAELLLGPVQMFGIFAFQRARILAGLALPPATSPRLEPRLRDCIVLAGRGLRDKQIAHQLGLTHRTVESYLRDARRLFGARSKTDLVCAAILAGEVSLHEVGSGQAP